jgi:hypothetical protein
MHTVITIAAASNAGRSNTAKERDTQGIGSR